MRGLGKHKKSCFKTLGPTPNLADTEDDPDPESGEGVSHDLAVNGPDFDTQATDDLIHTETAEIAEDINEVDAEGSGGSIDEAGESGECKSAHSTASLTPGLIGPGVRAPKAGDIIIEYHPHSKRDTRIVSTEEFKASLIDDSDPTSPPDDEPWRPFRSREDFEFAELVHDASLNRSQIEKFIKLIRRCQDAPGSLTFKNHNDLKVSLETASKMLTPVNI